MREIQNIDTENDSLIAIDAFLLKSSLMITAFPFTKTEKYLKRNISLSTLYLNAEGLPVSSSFLQGSFDTVICYNPTSGDALSKYQIQEAIRICKPDGRLVFLFASGVFKNTFGQNLKDVESSKIGNLKCLVKQKTACSWIDVCTLVVPRMCVSDLVNSLFDHLDKGAYKLRWAVHYDPVQNLAHLENKCIEEIGRQSAKFDDFDIIIRDKNVGHQVSFFASLGQLKYDCIYAEDDMLFFSDFSIDELVSKKADFVSLAGINRKPGNTDAGFWSKKFVDCLISQKGKDVDTASLNIEKWNRNIFLQEGLIYGKGYKVAKDNGISSLTNERLIRSIGENTEPSYIKAPDLTMIVFWNDGHTPESTKRYRDWSLCEEAFKVSYIQKGCDIDFSQIDTEWVALIAANVRFGHRAKSIIPSLNQEHDALSTEDALREFVIIRTSIAKRATTHTKSNKPQEIMKSIEQIINSGKIKADMLFKRTRRKYFYKLDPQE
jgi:SAM-dependent methyltransferase